MKCMTDRKKVISHLLINRTWNVVGRAYAHDKMDKTEKAKTVEWIDDTLKLLEEQQKLIDKITLRRANNGAFD